MVEKFPVEFNPKLLFTWKGLRTKTESKYHNHDYIEVVFIMNGKECYRIDDVLYEVQEGDVLILNEGVLHQAVVPSGAEPVTEVIFAFSDIVIDADRPNYLCIPGMPVLHTDGDLKHNLFKLCMHVISENENSSFGRYVMMKSYLIQFLVLILREFKFSDRTSIDESSYPLYRKSNIVNQILMYFEEHYAEKISLDSIADNMYISSFYISKIFKSETGDTPIRHLINIRLEKAKDLLIVTPHRSIKEIASDVGYEDVYHFSKQFKKKYQLSPSKYREIKLLGDGKGF